MSIPDWVGLVGGSVGLLSLVLTIALRKRQERSISNRLAIISRSIPKGRCEMQSVQIDPGLLDHLLSVGRDGKPMPIYPQDVHKVIAVKVSDEERVKIQTFIDYLHDRGFIPDRTFASLFRYIFNYVFTIHEQQAKKEAREEAAV